MEENAFFAKSKDKKVHELLEELMTFDSEKFSIVEELRKIVFENFQAATEKMMYGGIMFTL